MNCWPAVRQFDQSEDTACASGLSASAQYLQSLLQVVPLKGLKLSLPCHLLKGMDVIACTIQISCSLGDLKKKQILNAF